jgi:hypothetical protein
MAKNPKGTGWFTIPMGPGVSNLYNKGFTLHVTHIPTGHEIEFPAFITDQSDAYTSNWTEETVFGRMDPIATFESTKRVVSLGFTVPSRSRHDALHNLGKLNTLLSFLYPTYASVPGATVMNMGPLVRVKYANLICSTENPSQGLLGYITTGITLTPDLEAGVLARSTGASTEDEKSLAGGLRANRNNLESAKFKTMRLDANLLQHGSGIDGAEILYKAYNLNFELSVLHEHSLGFEKRQIKGKEVYVFRNKTGRFPYNTGHHTSPNQILNRGESEALQPVQSAPAPTDATPQDPETREEYLEQIRNNAQLNSMVAQLLSQLGKTIDTATDAELGEAYNQSAARL